MTVPNKIPNTTEQAAARLGVKPGTLEVWRCQGRGPRFVKIGRAVRYLDPDLDAFVDQGRCSSTSEYPLRRVK